MIADLLNRDFVLQQLHALAHGIETFDDRRGGEDLPEIANDLHPAELTAALNAIRTAISDETAESSGQSVHQPDGGAAIDETAFISRDPIVSIVQSALECTAQQRDAVPVEPVPGDDRRGAVADRRLGGAFEVTDIRWAACIVAMGLRKLNGKHAFNPRPADDVTLQPNARLVIVGDWATGIDRALLVRDQMRKVIDDGIAQGLDQHVIHLGDVYYSGFEHEYKERLLTPWPVHEDEAAAIGSWTLNGNHDMYGGGWHYFDTGLGDPRFARHQGSSFFALGNADWNVVGLDTAYDEHDLHDPQADFLRHKQAEGKKMLLLSHHQLFSNSDAQGPKLEAKLKDVLATGVKAWFWGHEHRCVLYAKDPRVEYARCVGHGGVPVYQNHVDGDPVAPPGVYEFRGSNDGDAIGRWARFGFAVLDFDGPRIQVRYIDEGGTPHKTEVIE